MGRFEKGCTEEECFLRKGKCSLGKGLQGYSARGWASRLINSSKYEYFRELVETNGEIVSHFLELLTKSRAWNEISSHGLAHGSEGVSRSSSFWNFWGSSQSSTPADTGSIILSPAYGHKSPSTYGLMDSPLHLFDCFSSYRTPYLELVMLPRTPFVMRLCVWPN